MDSGSGVAAVPGEAPFQRVWDHRVAKKGWAGVSVGIAYRIQPLPGHNVIICILAHFPGSSCLCGLGLTMP